MDIRKLNQKTDLEEVLAIELRDTDEYYWPEWDFVNILHQDNIYAIIGEIDNEIVGYMLYFMYHRCIKIISLAIKKKYRRQGFGSKFLHYLELKQMAHGRDCVYGIVRESSLAIQLFFKKNGYTCKNIEKKYYSYVDEDGYIFQKGTEDRIFIEHEEYVV